MTSGTIERMVDENYADFFIEYYNDPLAFEPLNDGVIHIINTFYGMIHVPLTEINEQTVLERGYGAIPKIYGLISDASIEASGITRLRSIPNFNLFGQGVMIGIVDTGVDYTNPIFQNADGSTRIYEIWDQSIQEDGNHAHGYGTVYTRERINEALRSPNPLEIVPSMDTNGHGTMIAGIAAGNPVPEQNFSGVSPEAELVVIKLKQAKRYLRDFFFIPENVECFQSTDILIAVQYLLEVAIRENKPMVVCIALGSSQGGHDGLSVLATALSLQANRPGFGMIVAAGNEGNSRRHYQGQVDIATGRDTVELNVGPNVAGFSMELWAFSPSLFSIDIQSPSGEYVPRIVAGLDENRIVTFLFEETIIYIDYQIVESQTGDQLILIRFSRPTEGIWRFNVYERGDLNVTFNIWLPMGDFLPDNTFFLGSDPYTTILSVGNAMGPATITAYNDADDSLYINASRGFSRIGTIKPEVAAPGVNVTGPDLNHGFRAFSGTSVSAAHTAGVAVILMEWGVVRGNLPFMSTIEIKKLMMRGARREPGVIYPNRDWGYGILDAYDIFDSLRTGIV